MEAQHTSPKPDFVYWRGQYQPYTGMVIHSNNVCTSEGPRPYAVVIAQLETYEDSNNETCFKVQTAVWLWSDGQKTVNPEPFHIVWEEEK